MTKIANSDLIIRRAVAQDIAAAGKVHQLAFPRQTHSQEWIECVFNSFPKSQLFVAELSNQIVGLIFWTEKSGFRKEAVVELEQIAVLPEYQGRGIGVYLIIHSAILVAEKIAERGAKLCHILGNTRVDNRAFRLYKKLGAQQIGSISGLFSADEVFMAICNIDADELIKQANQTEISKEPNTKIPYMVLRGLKNSLKRSKAI